MSNYRIHAPTTHKLFASRTRRSLRGGHSLGFWNWDHVEKFSIRIRGWRFLEGWKDSKAVSRRVNLGRASTEAKIEAVERPLTRQRYISFSLGRRGNLRRRERTVYSSAWTKFESLKVPWYPADSRYAIDSKVWPREGKDSVSVRYEVGFHALALWYEIYDSLRFWCAHRERAKVEEIFVSSSM